MPLLGVLSDLFRGVLSDLHLGPIKRSRMEEAGQLEISIFIFSSKGPPTGFKGKPPGDRHCAAVGLPR